MSNVPYQAYKSKRHSRTASNPRTSPVVSPSSPSLRPSSAAASGSLPSPTSTALPAPFTSNGHSAQSTKQNGHVSRLSADLADIAPWNRPKLTVSPLLPPPETNSISNNTLLPVENSSTLTTPPSAAHASEESLPTASPSPSSSPSPAPTPAPASNGNGLSSPPTKPVAAVVDSHPEASSSKASTLTPRRTSTFRHIPLRNSSAPTSPSPLRSGTHIRTSSLASPHLEPTIQSKEIGRSRTSGPFGMNSSPRPLSQSASPSSTTQPLPAHKDTSFTPVPPILPEVVQPAPRSLGKHLPKSPNLSPASSLSPAGSPHPRAGHTPAPYRPGFQPRGQIVPRTDEFLELRKAQRDIGRVERTRLERRLEKIINLHFGSDSTEKIQERPRQTRRMSSIWDFDFKNVDASDLWRNVVQREPTPGSKADIRAMEQSITPWMKDADVSQCLICSTSFHSITNRKHHCRLCGKIICSLPIKRPQRPVLCSTLFVVEPKTGKIEEVSEGVDYGVRKRTMSTASARGTADESTPDEKFLKGVRICRDCRPVLLRQQHTQEASQIPTFSRLYAAFVELEREVEDALPQFQELLLSLNNSEQPTAEAAAARRKLIEAFAQYDAVAKRIRKLPTPGPSSSQERVQAAILSRANIFLQKHMVPLQAIPTPKQTKSPGDLQSTSSGLPSTLDPDSMAAHALQPLLEQEALLETFVQEAKAHRKFEDVRTLKANLAEIRGEIDSIMVNAQTGVTGALAKS